jgi:hypothetical protein
VLVSRDYYIRTPSKTGDQCEWRGGGLDSGWRTLKRKTYF